MWQSADPLEFQSQAVVAAVVGMQGKEAPALIQVTDENQFWYKPTNKVFDPDEDDPTIKLYIDAPGQRTLHIRSLVQHHKHHPRQADMWLKVC